MTQKIKIIDAGKLDSLADNTTVIDVTYNVVDVAENGDETILGEFRESFSLKCSKEEIETYLAKKLSTFKLEQAQAEAQKEVDETSQAADATIESLKDLEVTGEVKEESEQLKGNEELK